MNEPETIAHILKNTKTIAVVGLSDRPERASFSVSQYLQKQGYRILPVNPRLSSVLGETAYPTLDAAAASAGKIDLVNVFRSPEFVPEIVKDVVRLKIPNLWLQQGVCHEEAAREAEANGVHVVMDHCIYLEHRYWSSAAKF